MPVPIEITILGSGSAIPSKKRKNPSILFKYEGDYMLFDIGECTQVSLQKINVSPVKIKRILITHWHADHFGGLIPFIETSHMLGRKKKLEIVAPEAEWFVEKIMELSYLDFGFKIKPKNVSTEEKSLVVREKKYKIFSLPVEHSVPAVGYVFKEKDHWKISPSLLKKFSIPKEKIEELKTKRVITLGRRKIKISDIAKKINGRKIAYSGDTIPLEHFFREVENGYMIHEATFLEPVKGIKHSSIKEVCTLAKKYKIKKIILTHFSRRYTDNSLLRREAAKIYDKCIIAEDGMKITF